MLLLFADSAPLLVLPSVIPFAVLLRLLLAIKIAYERFLTPHLMTLDRYVSCVAILQLVYFIQTLCVMNSLRPGAVCSPLMLQKLHHHTCPQETHHHWTK